PKNPHPALWADLSRRERDARAAPSVAKAVPLPPGEVGPKGRVRVLLKARKNGDQREESLQSEFALVRIEPLARGMHIARGAARSDRNRGNAQGHRNVRIRGAHVQDGLRAKSSGRGQSSLDEIGLDRRSSDRPVSRWRDLHFHTGFTGILPDATLQMALE